MNMPNGGGVPGISTFIITASAESSLLDRPPMLLLMPKRTRVLAVVKSFGGLKRRVWIGAPSGGASGLTGASVDTWTALGAAASPSDFLPKSRRNKFMGYVLLSGKLRLQCI